MNNRILLAKCINLLYKEHQLPGRTENSADLVRTAINTIKLPEQGVGVASERDIIKALKDILSEMCSNPIDFEYDPSVLSQQVNMSCGADEDLIRQIEDGLKDPTNEAVLKRSIIHLRKSINNYFRETQIREIIDRASYDIKFKRDKISDMNEFIANIIMQLEPLTITSGSKDPAIVSEVDIGDAASMTDVLKIVKNNNTGTGVLKTGWQDLNEMMQGGIRRGEAGVIGALQHKYKTGFSLTLFKQIALYNEPVMIDGTKKPLLLRISFEDDLNLNLAFLYKSLKYDETRQKIDIKDVSVEEMNEYIRRRLQVNGYQIKLLRVDPSQWSYKHICNKIIELEAQGYEIHLLMLDYLAMLPRTGCITTGPTGTDLRDMFRRMRNFCSPRKIALVTPHQLSTEAKQLIRNGVPEVNFVKDINEKGYYEGSRQIDQEVDWEIYIHLFSHNRETYLAVQRGKHRLDSIVHDEQKYFLLKFPKGSPIPDDVDDPYHKPMRRLPTPGSNTDESDFSFS